MQIFNHKIFNIEFFPKKKNIGSNLNILQQENQLSKLILVIQ